MPVSSHTDVKLWFGSSLNHASPLSAQTIPTVDHIYIGAGQGDYATDHIYIGVGEGMNDD